MARTSSGWRISRTSRRGADSSGRRNSFLLPSLIDGLEQFVQRLGRGFPAKSFAGPGIEGKRDEGFKAQVRPYIERIPLEEECDGQDLSVL